MLDTHLYEIPKMCKTSHRCIITDHICINRVPTNKLYVNHAHQNNEISVALTQKLARVRLHSRDLVRQ